MNPTGNHVADAGTEHGSPYHDESTCPSCLEAKRMIKMFDNCKEKELSGCCNLQTLNGCCLNCGEHCSPMCLDCDEQDCPGYGTEEFKF
jgi:hypothetical protein